MTKEEAQTVLDILITADNGCATCTGSLLKKFVRKFPQFTNLADEIWIKEFPDYGLYSDR